MGMEPSSLTSQAIKIAIKSALSRAGVTLDGSNAYDLKIHDERFWQRIAAEGYVGLGEAFMDGWWTCEDLATLVYKISSTGVESKLADIEKILPRRAKSRKNGHSVAGETEAIRHHYDIGLELYEPMLGPTMQYSCSKDFEQHGNLNDAQMAKMIHLGQKLNQQPGALITEVGCGYGTLAHMLNKTFGYLMRGMTLSDVQLAYALQHCRGTGNEFYHQNYQKTPNRLFPRHSSDGVISVGMIEHVGKDNLGPYFMTCADLLNDDGVAVIHGICTPHPEGNSNAWIEKYIFPGGYIPAQTELVRAANDAGFAIRDIENIGLNYDPTLLAWRTNVMAIKEQLIATGKYDERFFRMWDFYLSTCAGKFRTEDLHVWQMVLTKKGSRRPYKRAA